MKHRSQPQFDHNYNPYEKPGLSPECRGVAFAMASVTMIVVTLILWVLANEDAIDAWMNQ